jgi:hypothetical protein
LGSGRLIQKQLFNPCILFGTQLFAILLPAQSRAALAFDRLSRFTAIAGPHGNKHVIISAHFRTGTAKRPKEVAKGDKEKKTRFGQLPVWGTAGFLLATDVSKKGNKEKAFACQDGATG